MPLKHDGENLLVIEGVLEKVMSKIYDREIWIPEYGVRKYHKRKINKWYNKHISLNLKNYNGETI